MAGKTFFAMISTAALVLVAWSPALAQQDCDAYYVIVFGAQRHPPTPKYSHTWATFVRVGPGDIESHTISWLAATGKLRLRSLTPERGRDFDLHSTIEWAFQSKQRISVWGPYPIKKELYCRALKQCALLDSGKIRYKVIDAGYFTSHVSNCIHAVSATVGGNRLHVLSPNFGETASFYVLARMRRWILDCQHTEDWLLDALGLNCYRLIHRDWENPRTGVLWTAIRALFDCEDDESGPPDCIDYWCAPLLQRD